MNHGGRPGTFFRGRLLMRIWKRIDLGAERRSYDLPIDGTVTTVYKVVVRVRARARVRVGIGVSASADPAPNPHLPNPNPNPNPNPTVYKDVVTETKSDDLRKFVAEKKETRRFDDMDLGEIAYKEITEKRCSGDIGRCSGDIGEI